jgi:UDP-N-acetylglucosamine:LPS N-acetylglucosamine transferase
MDNSKLKRVVVLGAGGGHLTEALMAIEGVPMDRTIATFCLSHTRESLKSEKVYCLIDPHGNLFKYMINFVQSIILLLKVRPRYVINTGGGMTIATSLLGKLFGAKLIYVESGARVTTPSKTGKLLYKYADLFIVQWKPLLKHFPNAVYGGVLL